MRKGFPDTTTDAINDARPEGATNADEPLEHNTYTGGADMSHCGQYTDSPSAINLEHCANGGRS